MKKMIILLIILVTGILVAYFTGAMDLLKNVQFLLTWFQNLGWIGYLAFILLSIVVAVFLLPGQLLAIVAGITYGWFLGGTLTVIGATLGSSISFAIGKYFAGDTIRNKFANNETFQKIEKGVEKNGTQFLILTRMVPIFPYAIQSYAYALTPMTLTKFTVISFFTMIPASYIYAYMAAEIITNGFSVKLIIQFTVLGIVLFLLSFIPRKIAEKKKML